MKTVSELLELINQAITTNGSKYDQWFINFSGHVNKISISYYQAGWEMSKEMVFKKDIGSYKIDWDNKPKLPTALHRDMRGFGGIKH